MQSAAALSLANIASARGGGRMVIFGSSLMSGHTLRRRRAGMTGHGTAHGAAGIFCAWRTYVDNRQHGEEMTECVHTKTAWQLASRILRREKTSRGTLGGNTENPQSSTWKLQ